MSTDTLLRFGRCEIDIARRELRIQGTPVDIEPRPFDLLVHLVGQRHRVVSKQELLETVWPGRCVSPSVLPRAMMKLRHAIGDTEAQSMIRTVNRVGYRFTAVVDGGIPPTAPASEAPRLALLPFENATGDSTLCWVEIGLMAMVAEALGRDPRISLVAMQAVLGAVAVYSEVSTADRIAAVRRQTGANWVLQARVSRTPASCCLDFRLHGESAETELSGQVTAMQPTQLAPELVLALTAKLCRPQAKGAPAPVRFIDTLAAQAYARGLHAVAEQRWVHAQNLFRMALALEPGHSAVQLALLRTLAFTATDDAELKELARQLLAGARRGHDASMAPKVRASVGLYHRNRRKLDLADFQFELALSVARGQESLDWTAGTLLLRCAIALEQRRLADAADHLARARAICEHTGNRVLGLTVLNMDACLACDDGQNERYVQLSIEGAQRARALRRHRDFCDASGNASNGLVELGRLPEAAIWAEEGVAAALVLGDRAAIDDLVLIASIAYRYAGAPEACARLFNEVSALRSTPRRPESIGCAHGHYALLSGNPQEAARCFSAAMQLLREAKFSALEQDQLPWFIESLILADRLDEAKAEIHRALQMAHDGNQVLHVHLLRLQALLASRQGHRAEALQLLEQAFAAGPAPIWHAWICADAALLLSDAGEPRAAADWLSRIDPKIVALPVVVEARARLQRATGSTAGAGPRDAAARAARKPKTATDLLHG